MATIITKEQFQNKLKICQKGKHKLSENEFGGVFYTICGLLSTSVGNVSKLKEDDIIDANISGMEHICCTVCNSNVVHKESNIKIK